MQTPQQQKLVKLLIENLGRKKSKRSLRSLMLEAGYSESSAKNPLIIFSCEGVKEGLEPIVDSLIKQRNNAVARLNRTIGRAKYRDLVDGIDKLTKNIQLLSGGKTENISLDLLGLLKKADLEQNN